MRAGPGRRPSRALPPLHAHELRRRVHLHDAVDLAVRVRVVLAPDLLGVRAVHEDGGDAEEPRCLRRQRDLAPAVLAPVDLGLRYPALLNSLLDIGAEVVVVGVAGAVLLVEPGLEVLARCSGRNALVDAVDGQRGKLTGLGHLGGIRYTGRRTSAP